MFEQYPDMMTPEQVANCLQFSVEDVVELWSSGEIQAKRLGKHWRIPEPVLVTFLAVESQPTPKPAVELTRLSVRETPSPTQPQQPSASSIQPPPSARLLETVVTVEDEYFKEAVEHAKNGKYSQAIPLVKKVPVDSPHYRLAQENLNKWRKKEK